MSQTEQQQEAPAQTAMTVICKAIDKMEGSLAESLKGTGLSVSRFLATAKTAVQTHSDKDKLERADRQSLYLAIKKAASDGLMPDGREAALVVYNTKRKDANGADKWVNEVQYQPMVQGLVKLARKSGEIESVGAYIVHENDKFSYRAGIDPIPVHEADWFGKRGNPIGAWAFVKLKTGDYIQPVMLTKERIDRIATRSKVAKNYSPTEGKDFEEFWKKAAIRNVLKYAPKSTALEQALDDDDREFDLTKEDVFITPALPPHDAATGELMTEKRETKASTVIKGKAAERKADISDHDDQPSNQAIDTEYEEVPADTNLSEDDAPAL